MSNKGIHVRVQVTAHDPWHWWIYMDNMPDGEFMKLDKYSVNKMVVLGLEDALKTAKEQLKND